MQSYTFLRKSDDMILFFYTFAEVKLHLTYS